MGRHILKAVGIAALLVANALPALADPHPPATRVARQEPSSTCVLNSLLGRVGPSSGGRKVGLVIDVSGSMATNDPQNLRLTAAKSLNDALISQSEASSSQAADLVDVVAFSDVADVLYPLGDPAGANSIIDGIVLGYNTAIGGGIQAAIEDLTAPGNDPTANRTGIIVFTDGQDYPTSGKALTLSETQRAASLGIRVSFGFLTPTPQNQDVEILRAILQSGGIYATIDQASTQQAFVALVLANGLTNLDVAGVNATGTLLPGISTAKFLQTGTNSFTYAAQAGETFNVTVEALDPIALMVTLRDVSANTDIVSNTTDASGIAVVGYTAPSAMDVEVVVVATNASTGIFSVGLNSSIPLNETCNVTVTSPPTAQPSVYTGGAVSAWQGTTNLFAALTSILGLAVMAAML
ncbi:hypothetical protein PV04_06510 [Phialophora macrospora]|uniref:VWFA domain-containing protein n=1 Tax=Phialophora macrospora TaxID=1851006 RepID=A0A0D2FKH2_9EURO|nr:hypothetical protein PV04_06510 [Phialophora macrospora]